jgi:hypothetical protein
MNEILHIIGLCPDSLAHTDFLDIFILNYHEFINLINKGYDKIKN